jgi:hypothetical protein
METIRIASIDIGKINFAFLIEEINIERINLENIQKNQRYNIDGTVTTNFKKILDNVCINGTTILYKNSNITTGCIKGKYIEQKLFHNMNTLLDEYSNYFDTCSIIIIEKQMSFGKKINTMALKLGQNCMSYFIFKYGMFKTIIEFPAYYKTQILGCSKIIKTNKKGVSKYISVDKSKRKKWSIEEAINILTLRNDIITLEHLKTSKKKDDLADVLTQLQAFKYLFFIEKIIF